MENTFDSTYIINKERSDEFVAEASKLAVAVYTIPAFVWPELYKMIDIRKDIAMRVYLVNASETIQGKNYLTLGLRL